MVRERQVGTAAVNVERHAQVLAAHSAALDMPARATLAPGAFPAWLARFGGLPHGEIEGIALAVFKTLAVGAQFAMAALHLIDVAVGKLAVFGERTNAEIHVALHLVGMALLDEGLYELDHLVDLFGGFRADIGVFNAGRAHVGDERLGVFGGNFGGGAALFVIILSSTSVTFCTKVTS